MAAATKLKTTVENLPESRVRVEAEVPPAEVNRRMVEAAGRLGRDLRIPGFRRGKVPAPLIVQRVGRETVLDEAVRSSLGDWYLEAIEAAGVHPIGEPSVNIGELPEEGKPLTFTIEIGVRPEAELGDLSNLEVPRREAVVDDERVDAEIDRLRKQLSRLETVDRAAQDGDFVVLDFKGSIDDPDNPTSSSA